jgi:twinkle protein
VPKSDVRAYLLGERKVSEQALASLPGRRAGADDRLPEPPPDGDLAFVKYLGIDRCRTARRITRVEAECEPVLFGWQAIEPNAREVTITEGEIDA